MNYILLTIAFLIFTIYVIIVWINCGILNSVSESYYYLNKRNKWLFTTIMWGFSIPTMIVGATPLIFFAGAGICFVGTSPAFKHDDM